MGYGIDLIKSEELSTTEIKFTADIFDSNWLESRILEKNLHINNFSNQEFLSGYSFDSINKNIESELSLSSDITLNYSYIPFKIKANFDSMNLTNLSNEIYKYYFRAYLIKGTHEFNLSNTVDIETYRNHLSDNFKNDITDFVNGRMTADTFFSRYGTHVITRAMYGGIGDVYYICSSNNYDFEQISKNNLESTISSYLPQFDGTKIGYDFSMSSNYGIEYSRLNEKMKVKTIGGNATSFTNFSSFSSNYNTWVQSINNNQNIIDILEAFAIWELLPPSINNEVNVTYIKNQYIQYANHNKISDNLYNFSTNFPKINATLRGSEEYRIKDDGYQKNKMDILNFLEGNHYSINGLIESGYKFADIKITLDAKEVNEGKQEIYISYTEDSPIIKRYDFIYGGAGTTSNFSNVIASFKDIPLNNFAETEKLVIKYGANGNGNDDWINKNVRVQITFTRC